MSPIALADARTTRRGCCFCLAVTFFLLVSSFSGAQAYFPVREIADSRLSMRVHPILVFAAFSSAVQGQPFASNLQIRGGLAPYRFWIMQGALPSGLSLNTSTGIISGVPAVSPHRKLLAVADGRRNAVVAAALFAPCLVAVAFVAYTADNERSRRETESGSRS